jgi:hypothetical protein
MRRKYRKMVDYFYLITIYRLSYEDLFFRQPAIPG